MALSAIIDDKRLVINNRIKEICLDGMRDALRGIDLQVEAIDLVLLGISINETDHMHGIISPDCNDIGKESNDKKIMIISLNRLPDEKLGALLAFAVDKFGAKEMQENIDKAVELWQTLAEEGLKKLYCQYFLDFTTGQPDVLGFFDKIHRLLNDGRNANEPNEL